MKEPKEPKEEPITMAVPIEIARAVHKRMAREPLGYGETGRLASAFFDMLDAEIAERDEPRKHTDVQGWRSTREIIKDLGKTDRENTDAAEARHAANTNGTDGTGEAC